MSTKSATTQLLDEIAIARSRIGGMTERTPLIRSVHLEARVGSPVYLKLENRQTSGSFKYRGALNKALAARDRGATVVCTGSTGNHALALAHAAQVVGLRCVVLLPSGVSTRRVDLLMTIGVEPEIVDGDVLVAELEARRRGESQPGFEYVSPYNDLEVIAGHALMGDEVLLELGGQAVNLFCATGGGGLVSGVGVAIKADSSESAVYSVSPSASPVLARGVKRGFLIEEDIQPTVSDATAGNIEIDSITLDLCRSVVDDYIEVPEGKLLDALDLIRSRDSIEVEGAAALAVAGLLQVAHRIDHSRVAVVVICGGN